MADITPAKAHGPTHQFTLRDSVATTVRAAGFQVAGVIDLDSLHALGSLSSPPGMPESHPFARDLAGLDRWLDKGAHASMSYMARNREARANPRMILESARSALIVIIPYASGKRVRGSRQGAPVGEQGAPESDKKDQTGIAPLVARYAKGSDYHKVLKTELGKLAESLKTCLAPTLAGEHLSYRVVVDSIPFFDRAFAREAGIGFVGKNTMLIRPGLGSFTFVATLLLSVPAHLLATATPPSALSQLDCGQCTRCLDACPTGALTSPRFLDANRCLSYLTIEHRGLIPDGFLPHFKETIYGCDICQEVCPYNFSTVSFVRNRPLAETRSALLAVSVADVARMNQRDYETWFGGSAMTRARFEGLVRNAMYHLWATHSPELPEILKSRQNDANPAIRKVVTQLKNLGKTP